MEETAVPWEACQALSLLFDATQGDTKSPEPRFSQPFAVDRERGRPELLPRSSQPPADRGELSRRWSAQLFSRSCDHARNGAIEAREREGREAVLGALSSVRPPSEPLACCWEIGTLYFRTEP